MGGAARPAPGETFRSPARDQHPDRRSGVRCRCRDSARTASAGLMSTASGLVFFGENSGSFMAADAATARSCGVSDQPGVESLAHDVHVRQQAIRRNRGWAEHHGVRVGPVRRMRTQPVVDALPTHFRVGGPPPLTTCRSIVVGSSFRPSCSRTALNSGSPGARLVGLAPGPTPGEERSASYLRVGGALCDRRWC